MKESQQPLHLAGQNSKDIDLQRNPTVVTPVKTGRKRKIAVCIRTGGGSQIISRAGYPTTWLFFPAIAATFRSDSEQLRAICAETVFPVTNDVFLYESRGLVPPKERVFQNSWKVGRVHRSVSLAPINSPVYPYAHFLSVIPPKPSLRLLRLMPNIVQQESTRSRGWHTHFCLSR